MNPRIIQIFLFSILILSETLGEEGKVLEKFDEANQIYAEGADYESAKELYLDILESEGVSVGLLLNLANTHIKLTEYGHARYRLEQLLLINPGNPDAINNLDVVLEKLEIEPKKNLLEPVYTILNTDSWFIISWSLIVIAGLVATFTLVRSRSVKLNSFLRAWVNPWVLSLITISIFGYYLSQKSIDRYGDGVIVSKTAELHLSPFEKSDVTFKVKEGEVFEILQIHQGFIYLEHSEQNAKGWAKSEDIAVIQ